MKNQKKIALLSLSVFMAIVLTSASLNNTLRAPAVIKPVEAYAQSQNMPTEITKKLSPLDLDGSMDGNELELVNALRELGSHVNSTLVFSVLDAIVCDGSISSSDLLKVHDVDNDYVANFLEISEYDSNPTKIDSDSGGLDDFNEIYTYAMNPNNPTDDLEFLQKIPNITALFWNQMDGGVNDWINYDEKCIAISLRDPYIRRLVERAEINWITTSEGKTEGLLVVDDIPINLGEKALRTTAVIAPAYYFTHNRTASCLPSTLAGVTILRAMGYKTMLVEGCVEANSSDPIEHIWAETCIQGEVYTVDYSRVVPRPASYGEWNWNATDSNYGRTPYDSDWYLK